MQPVKVLLCTAFVLIFTIWCGFTKAEAQQGGLEAQPRQAVPAGYGETLDRAVAEAARKNFVEARALFLEAHGLFPNARTLRALGVMEYELRDYVKAAAYLQQALDSTVRPLDRKIRGQTEQLLSEVLAYVARYTIDVTPRDAQLRLDDDPITLDDHASVLIQVGKHVLQASAPGYRLAERSLNVAGRQSETLVISLIPDVVAAPEPVVVAPAPRAPSPTAAPATNKRKKRWLWATLGVVVAGAAAGATIALATRHSEKEAPYSGTTMSILAGPQQ